MSWGTESLELHSALPVKFLPVLGQKLKIVTNGDHIDVYRTCKKLCDVQCLNVYKFIRHTSWLKIYNVLLTAI
jgi:hypothetical protein